MTRYVAFLRAINVGGHTVKMDKLRALFEEMGFANVSTFIASGNVIFDSPSNDVVALERQIEDHLKAALGYEVVTFLRTPKQLAKIIELQPFPESEVNAPDTTLYIGFLTTAPAKAAVDKLMTFSTRETELRVRDREVYWLARAKFSESAFTGARMERTLGMPSTIRNITTVRKVREVAAGMSEMTPVTGLEAFVATPRSSRPLKEAKVVPANVKTVPATPVRKKRGADRRVGERRKRDE